MVVREELEDRWSLYARCPRGKGYDDLCFVVMVQGERNAVIVGECVYIYILLDIQISAFM